MHRGLSTTRYPNLDISVTKGLDAPSSGLLVHLDEGLQVGGNFSDVRNPVFLDYSSCQALERGIVEDANLALGVEP